MGISVLEPKEVKPMPKHVNADKLIARMREIADGKWSKRAAPVCWSDAYEHFIDELEEAETEDVAPVVHAHWKEDGEVCVCSNCGEEHAWGGYRADYCDVCGAKMDEGEES